MLLIEQKQNVHKVAILLTILGKEVAQEILKQFEPSWVERIGKEMLKLGEIPKEEGQKIVKEFLFEFKKQKQIGAPDAKVVQEVVTNVMGAEKAGRLIKEEMERHQVATLFENLKDVEPAKLITVLKGEHPQAIALVLASLPPDLSAAILSHLPEIKQTEVVRRLATLDQSQPDMDMVHDIEQRLMKNLHLDEQTGKKNSVGGIQTCADILSLVDKVASKRILEEFTAKQTALADAIKLVMVRFDDITKLDNLEVQRVLKEIETQDLVLACMKAPKDVEDTVFHNLSARGAEMLKEDMDVMRNVKPEAIRTARQKIAEVMRRLDEEGVIMLNKTTLENELV
jgi:flagellar motor switch protein FliG